MAKLDIGNMTPAEIRAHNLALWQQMMGQTPTRTAADIRGDQDLRQRVIVVYLGGNASSPAAAPQLTPGSVTEGSELTNDSSNT